MCTYKHFVWKKNDRLKLKRKSLAIPVVIYKHASQ
jgi:hypothetical protein